MNYKIQSNTSSVTIFIDVQYCRSNKDIEMKIADAVNEVITSNPNHPGCLIIALINLSPTSEYLYETVIKNLQDIHILHSYRLGESSFTQITLYTDGYLNNEKLTSGPIILADNQKLEEMRRQYYIKRTILNLT